MIIIYLLFSWQPNINKFVYQFEIKFLVSEANYKSQMKENWPREKKKS